MELIQFKFNCPDMFALYVAVDVILALAGFLDIVYMILFGTVYDSVR
jgi:hypothetical protein|tara:strand:- start:380 stop:520 length:141 start_codon:yes stop_codon:yes gene_type:complete